ncbi:host cell division inhibitor Icd-like protein [Providencia huaxiensis]|nr:host cell division inhibitor Icd-like protein [Providencia huaxiensis]MBQ0590097.1 host cell division inhibitor Icd-like protein [Providencia huaxiensis]
MAAINSTMFDTPNRGNQSSNTNQLTPDWVNIAYQVNDSLLAGGESVKVDALLSILNLTSSYSQSDKFSSGYSANILAQQSAKTLADVLAKIYANQSPKFTGNKSGEYFSGYKSADILRYSNLSHSKRGGIPLFNQGVKNHLGHDFMVVTTRGGIEFCQSIKKERIEFLESIKKGSQSATLGNVDIEYRASENINISLLLWYGKYQLLGSMPRDCNSFRITLLIHAARDSSPSCACATSIISLSSGSSLNWNGGFPRLSVLCVDTSITPVVWYLCVITHYTLATQKTMPRSGGTLTGHLTTNDNTSIEVAMSKHNTPVTGRTSLTPNQSYRWLFLALNRSDYTAKPCRIAVTAPNENSARLMLVRDYMLIFAGRLPAIGGKHHA